MYTFHPETDKAFKQFCKTAQQELSSTASNYDLTQLYTGIGLSALAIALILIPSWPLLRLSESFTGWVFSITIILNGIMMFASSYVEEEQHFWYWITSAFLTMPLFQR